MSNTYIWHGLATEKEHCQECSYSICLHLISPHKSVFFIKESKYAYRASSNWIVSALGCDMSVTSEMIGPTVIVLLVEQEAESVDGWQ